MGVTQSFHPDQIFFASDPDRFLTPFFFMSVCNDAPEFIRLCEKNIKYKKIFSSSCRPGKPPESQVRVREFPGFPGEISKFFKDCSNRGGITVIHQQIHIFGGPNAAVDRDGQSTDNRITNVLLLKSQYNAIKF